MRPKRCWRGEAEALTRRAVELALKGDGTALRLCLDRLVPPRKDRPVEIDLPAVQSAGDASNAMAAVVEAVAAGDLTPGEAETVAKLLDIFVRTLEATEFERRLTVLEEERSR